MNINNKSFDSFNMKVVSFSYRPFAISRNAYIPDRSYTPLLGIAKIQPKEMTLVIECNDKSDISKLIAELLNNAPSIINIDDGYLYQCYMKDVTANSVNEYWPGWYQVSIPLLVIQSGHEVYMTLTENENTIYVRGTYSTELYAEIEPKKDLPTFTIENVVTIKELKQNEKIIVDGRKKTVCREDGTNKYGDCIFVRNRFPYLEPGENTVKFNCDDAVVRIRFNPIYI